MTAVEFLLNYFSDRSSNLPKLCHNLDYQFNDYSLLVTAMTHRSALNELLQKFPDPKHQNLISELNWNEKLEFLGDSVLSLSTSSMLWNTQNLNNEGDLTLARAALVKESSLFEIAKLCEVNNCLIVGSSLIKAGNNNLKSSVLANAVEALFGAIYLDSGFDQTKSIIKKIYYNWLGDSFDPALLNDHKSVLQEYTQKHYNLLPTYHLVQQTGPDHNKNFIIECRIKDLVMGVGSGASKKKASQQAALNALSKDFTNLE